MADQGKTSLRRRRYIIDKSYQYKFISVVLLSIAVVFLLCLVLILNVLSTVMDEFFEIPGAAAKYPALLKAVVAGTWPWLVLILVVGFCLSVLISHQIAGPIYRLKLVSREIAAGNYRAKVQFRRRDQLQDVDSAVNSTTAKLGGVIEEDKKLLVKINELLLEVEQLAEAGALDKKSYKKLKSSLQSILRKIKSQLAK